MRELKHKTYVGQSGCGKTTFAKKEVLKHAKKYSVVVFLNTQHEKFVDDMCDNIAWTISELDSFIQKGKRIVVFKIPLDEEIDDAEEFELLLIYLWSIKRLNEEKYILLVIDEADRYCTKLRIPKIYSDLLTKGRRYNFEIWNITQRPQLINNIILTQSKELIIFELSEYDYQFMSKWFDYENPELYSFVIIKN
ncbi:MAG: AAA family ATPase [Candidatus Heimdallarchaeota archaeon]|nr:MAG: AAA family ATPase [Candidatus Heimdallarchaeota archaeon]